MASQPRRQFVKTERPRLVKPGDEGVRLLAVGGQLRAVDRLSLIASPCFPRIDEFNADALEISDVASGQGEIVGLHRSRDESVAEVQRMS